jgi:alpha-N-arabinofuranosidase
MAWGHNMHGVSLHRYIVPWLKSGKRGEAVDFDVAEWHSVMQQSFDFDRVIRAHSKIMDKFDPKKKIGLVVDEWGTWFNVEKGTNPGFLYQQNTVRDAVSAAVVLNIFNNHADRVCMANIAQTVNVLQAMLLTRGKDMLLTPSYHVFEMFKKHQGATLLNTALKAPGSAFGSKKLPSLSASASQHGKGVLLTLANASPDKAATLNLAGAGLRAVESARLLAGDSLNAHNDFNKKQRVQPAVFKAITAKKAAWQVRLPAASVLALELSAARPL